MKTKTKEIERKITKIATQSSKGEWRYLYEDELPKESERILVTPKIKQLIKKYLAKLQKK